jgi:anhydro-N-acetylmuramic acid kinase
MNIYRVAGLMSGTSLDGVDIALCVFEKSRGTWKFRIEAAETISYKPSDVKLLTALMQADAMSYARQNTAYGCLLGELVKSFLKRHRASADFISSHGHTIFHQPSNKFTTQIGEGAALSIASGLPVVCDFRTVDVALGGQGAPLVPIGDQLLFNQYEYCLNLGGIANISFERSGKRIAFDICPVNMVMNHLAQEKGKRFDKGGRMAAKGYFNIMLLAKLSSVPYYRRPIPKSLGREEIEKYFFRIMKNDKSRVEDKLQAFCEHIAIKVASVTKNAKGQMLVTGGGAYNDYLISRIKAHSRVKVVIPSKKIIEFKEALIFAFLGVLRWRNEVNCLKSVTGASRDSCGGAIYQP